jgi:hypothetical protein
MHDTIVCGLATGRFLRSRWLLAAARGCFRGHGVPALMTVSALALVMAACKSKDPEKCQQGMSVTRQAITSEDFPLAQQWRDYAYKQCDDTASLSALDQEIVSKRAAVEQRQQDIERKKTETAQLVQVFTKFVGDSRAAVDRASSAARCDDPPEGAPPVKAGQIPERWCNASRAAGQSYMINLRYWDADKEAFRFVTRPPNPVSCADLGATSVLRAWDVPATDGRSAKRSHCEFTAGPLSGLHALVSEAANADVHVFSPKYLDRDSAMKAMVGG